MRPAEQPRWRERLLEDVFAGIAMHDALVESLVFKGARILAYLLPQGESRQSLDLDANCTAEFLNAYADRQQQADVLRRRLSDALTAHFERQDPVTRSLERVLVIPKPAREHPRGWNAFDVRIRINDRQYSSQRGIPTLEIDIAYPEVLSQDSTTELSVGGRSVRVYSLPRIAGEKLRAFLSSLPDHQRRIGRQGGAIRAKDLYDLTMIERAHPVADSRFWSIAAREFALACTSREVECHGWDSFSRHEVATRATYQAERTLPDGISFEQAWEVTRRIVARLSGST